MCAAYLCRRRSVRSWEEETEEGGAKPFSALFSTAASSSTECRREWESMELTVSEPDTDALWAAEWENAHRVRDTAHENRLHLSTDISPSKKSVEKGAGQNQQKKQIDRLEEISAPNFEGPQWAHIVASVTITLLKRSSPTPAMRSGVLLLLISGLLGFGMWTEFLQILYITHHIHLPVTSDVGKSALSAWYLSFVYWKTSFNDLKCYPSYVFCMKCCLFVVARRSRRLDLCCTDLLPSVVWHGNYMITLLISVVITLQLFFRFHVEFVCICDQS